MNALYRQSFYTIFQIIFLTLLFSVSSAFSQVWIFNNNSLNSWSTLRLTSSTSNSHVRLTTTGQNNPKFENSTANINADSNIFAIIKLRVDSGGPTLLRINFPNGNRTTQITPGSSDYLTYVIDMRHNNWMDTINNIELAFKNDDGTTGGGTHNSININIDIKEIAFVSFLPSTQSVLFVDPDNGNDASIGSSSAPLKTISYALDLAASNSISNVYLKSGSYNFLNTIEITTKSNSKVTLSPEPNGFVKLNLSSFRNFRFYQGARNIEISGFEMYGKSNQLDHWELLSKYVWLPQSLPDSLSGGGICFQIEDAEDIFITNNVIHDFYQKAINIENGRYITIRGNILT